MVDFNKYITLLATKYNDLILSYISENGCDNLISKPRNYTLGNNTVSCFSMRYNNYEEIETPSDKFFRSKEFKKHFKKQMKIFEYFFENNTPFEFIKLPLEIPFISGTYEGEEGICTRCTYGSPLFDNNAYLHFTFSIAPVS